MKPLNNFLAYILSVVLALGTINPFAFNSYQNEPSESIMISLFSVMFMIITFMHYGFREFSRLNRQIVVSIVFLIGTILIADIIYSLDSINVYFYVKFSIVLLVFFSLLIYFRNNPEMIQRCMLLFSLSCAILIFFAFTNGLFGYAETYKGRLYLYGENPNSTSSRMSMAILFFIYLFFSKKSKLYMKILWGACVFLLFVYIIRSGSRGSFLVTLMSALLVFLSSRGGFGTKTLFALLGLTVAFFFLPSIMQKEEVALFERMEELEEHNSRETLMQQAFTIFLDNPVVGVGSNGYNVEKARRGFDHRDSHNIITSILAMGGVVALSAFIILWLSLIRPTYRYRGKTIAPFVISISMFLISMKTGGVITFVLMWYVYAVSYCWSTNLKMTGNKLNK